MPRNPQGQFSLPSVYQATPGTTVRSEQHNVPLEDLAQAMTDSLPRNGSAPMTGPLAMGGRRITGLGTPTASGDATTKAYVDGRTGSPTAESLNMDGPGLVGRSASGAGPSRIINLAAGVEVRDGFLRLVLGSGLQFVGNAVAAVASVVSRFSTQSEALAGTNNDSSMTPLRVAQAIGAADIEPEQMDMSSPGLVGRSAGGSGDGRIINVGSGLTLLDGFLRPDVARTATGDEAREATNNAVAMTPLNTLQFANANLLGMFQAWTNASGIRSANTAYTNDTGKPIMVVVRMTGGSGEVQVAIEGSGNWVTLGTGDSQVFSIIVPPRQRYRITSPGFSLWSELR